jgi:hypothetical protein
MNTVTMSGVATWVILGLVFTVLVAVAIVRLFKK